MNCRFPDAIEIVRAAFKGLIPEERIIVFDVPPLVSWESPANVWRRRAAELIRETGAGVVVAPDDVEGLVAALRELHRRFGDGGLADIELAAGVRHQLSRQARVEETAELLRSLL